MTNPVQAFVGTYVSNKGAGQSGWATFSFDITAGFEAEIPVNFAVASAFSFAPEIYVWRSTDGRANWESNSQRSLMATFSAPATQTSQVLRKNITLDNGQYLIGVMAGSHQNQSFSITLDTARIITAYA